MLDLTSIGYCPSLPPISPGRSMSYASLTILSAKHLSVARCGGKSQKHHPQPCCRKAHMRCPIRLSITRMGTRSCQRAWIEEPARPEKAQKRYRPATGDKIRCSFLVSASVTAPVLLEVLQLGFGELPRAFDKLQPELIGAR